MAELNGVIVWQFFLIVSCVVATLFVVMKIALLIIPLERDVEIIKSIKDLYISLGFALVAVLGFLSVSYFNNNQVLLITIAISCVLSFYFSYVSLYALRNSLSIPLNMLKNVKNVKRLQRGQ